MTDLEANLGSDLGADLGAEIEKAGYWWWRELGKPPWWRPGLWGARRWPSVPGDSVTLLTTAKQFTWPPETSFVLTMSFVRRSIITAFNYFSFAINKYIY